MQAIWLAWVFNEPKGIAMKKSLVVACLLSVCALSGFAQSSAQVAGAKLVAEHDAAYAKADPSPYVKATMVKTTMPATHRAGKRHTHPMVKKTTKQVAQKKPALQVAGPTFSTGPRHHG